MKKFIMDKEKRTILALIISGICLIISFFNLLDTKIDIAIVAVILCGVPVLRDAIYGIISSFNIKAGVLVSMALISSLIIGSIFVAGEVAFIMILGVYLEDRTIAKTEQSVKKLLKLVPETARLIKNGKDTIIPSNQLKIGDIIRVLPGESVPVDGTILKGETSINQAIMTGESMPVDKTVGDSVFSGTVNQFGSFDMEVTKLKQDSSLQKLIELVQAADPNKSKIVRKADKWATAVVIIAFALAVLTWIITGEIIRAVTILVVFCPCALVLATPTAIMAGIGNATKHGILIKRGSALEDMTKVQAIVFDKTGTLTKGQPNVTKIHSFDENMSKDDLLTLAASIEKHSEHVIGKAIVDYSKDIKTYQVDDYKMNIGKGVSAIIDGSKVLAGNKRMLEDQNIYLTQTQEQQTQEYIEKGATLVYIVKNSIVRGFIVLEDVIRDTIKDTITQINDAKIDTMLLTGDNTQTAKNISQISGILDFRAECTPEDKLVIIDELQKEKTICMIGDGINDAPALKKADVGIAMGEIGSDIAIEAADIILIGDDIDKLPYLIRLSKKVMKTIYTNLLVSLVLNIIFIILSVNGMLTPVQGAIVHNIGSFSVIMNSSLLLKWKDKKGK